MLEPKCRKAMKGWPDSKVEEYQRQADILTDIMIEMYLAGVAVGGPAEARALVPDEIGEELEERSAVIDHVRRQRR